tara:strand:+ start:323 stop:529 length:207 start_codon:yes stop_codon:yes gene_type:complete
MKRLFNIGKVKNIADPAPNGTLAQAVEFLTASYPQLRHTRIYESDGVLSEDGKTLVFDVPLPTAKVNG